MDNRKNDPIYTTDSQKKALIKVIRKCMNDLVRTERDRFLKTHESLDDGYNRAETLASVKETLKNDIRSNDLSFRLEKAISDHLPNDPEKAKSIFIEFLDNHEYNPNLGKPRTIYKRKADTPLQGAPVVKRQSSREEPTGSRNPIGDLAQPSVTPETPDFFELPSTPPQVSGEVPPMQLRTPNFGRTPQRDVQLPPPVLEPSFTPYVPSVYRPPLISTTGFDGVTLAPIQVPPETLEPDFNPDNRYGSAIAPIRQNQEKFNLSFFSKNTSVNENPSSPEPSKTGNVKPSSNS